MTLQKANMEEGKWEKCAGIRTAALTTEPKPIYWDGKETNILNA